MLAVTLPAAAGLRAARYSCTDASCESARREYRTFILRCACTPLELAYRKRPRRARSRQALRAPLRARHRLDDRRHRRTRNRESRVRSSLAAPRAILAKL